MLLLLEAEEAVLHEQLRFDDPPVLVGGVVLAVPAVDDDMDVAVFVIDVADCVPLNELVDVDVDVETIFETSDGSYVTGYVKSVI